MPSFSPALVQIKFSFSLVYIKFRSWISLVFVQFRSRFSSVLVLFLSIFGPGFAQLYFNQQAYDRLLRLKLSQVRSEGGAVRVSVLWSCSSLSELEVCTFTLVPLHFISSTDSAQSNGEKTCLFSFIVSIFYTHNALYPLSNFI